MGTPPQPAPWQQNHPARHDTPALPESDTSTTPTTSYFNSLLDDYIPREVLRSVPVEI